MGSITLNKPSGGQLTIAPEDGTSNETISIPSVGVGKVLQVVEGKYIQLATTSTSLVDTSYHLSITPKSSTSKLILTFSGSGLNNTSSTHECVTRFGEVGESFLGGVYKHRDLTWFPVAMDLVIDSGSTSTRTYSIYFANFAGGQFYLGTSSTVTDSAAHFRITEVAA